MPASYSPLRGRAQAVTVVFAIIAVVCAGAVVSDWLEWRLMDRLIAGEPVTDAEATANDDRQRAIGLLQLALMVACAVVFIRWLYAAYRNLEVVAPAEKRYSPGWAIGSWFVPIMNLFRPKQMVNDVWRAGGRDSDDARPGRLLLGWWLLWLISSFVVNIAGRSYMRADTAEELQTGTMLYLLGDAMQAVAAVLAILVVRRGTERLDAKAAEVPPPSAPPEPDLVSPERPAGAPA
jgi:Domain of unknown function (DUF4328)